jgi:hypothetical protein
MHRSLLSVQHYWGSQPLTEHYASNNVRAPKQPMAESTFMPVLTDAVRIG